MEDCGYFEFFWLSCMHKSFQKKKMVQNGSQMVQHGSKMGTKWVPRVALGASGGSGGSLGAVWGGPGSPGELFGGSLFHAFRRQIRYAH